LLNLIDVSESMHIWKHFFLVCEQIHGNNFLEERERDQSGSVGVWSLCLS